MRQRGPNILKTTENQDRLVNWAVETLAHEPCVELPEGFLAKFETQLSQEPEPSVVVELLPTSLSEPTRHWTRGLMAALVMLAVLGAFLILKPKSGSEVTGLMVVSALNEVEVASISVSEVTALKSSQSIVTKADSEVVLMAGNLRNTVRVGPDSEIRLNETKRSEGATLAELSLERGSLYVSEKEAKISVKTRHAHIRPIGTEYKVTETTDGTKVAVSEGSVLVTPSGGNLIRLNAGEQILVDSQAKKDAPRPVRMKSEPLKNLKKEFEASRTTVKKAPKLGSPLAPYPKAARANAARAKAARANAARAKAARTNATRSKQVGPKTIRPNFGRAKSLRQVSRRRAAARAMVSKSAPARNRGVRQARRRQSAQGASAGRTRSRSRRRVQAQRNSTQRPGVGQARRPRAGQAQGRWAKGRRAGVAYPKARAQRLKNRSTKAPSSVVGSGRTFPVKTRAGNRMSRPSGTAAQGRRARQGQTWKSRSASLKKRPKFQRRPQTRKRTRANRGNFRRR